MQTQGVLPEGAERIDAASLPAVQSASTAARSVARISEVRDAVSMRKTSFTMVFGDT